MVSQVAVLLGYCYLVDRFATFTATTVWTAILLAAVARFVLATTVFARGRWRHIKVELEDQESLEPVESGALGG